MDRVMAETSTPNEINGYFHCATCLPEKPKESSPREWASLEVGFTDVGVQVWCKRCEKNVAHIDFEGARHSAR